jgi:hypothetical protein
MDKILAQRFAPFNFSAIPGFPNVVPTIDEWVDFFPIYKEHKDDNPAQHPCEFHELMHQWEIHHDDVLLKMFMLSLAGDDHCWPLIMEVHEYQGIKRRMQTSRKTQ